MNKFNFFLFFLFFSFFLSAKIDIKGAFINNTTINEKVSVHIYKGSENEEVGVGLINKQGDFVFVSEIEYTGFLSLKIGKSIIGLVSDNSPISFKYDLKSNIIISISSDINKDYQSHFFYLSKEDISQNIKKTLSYYNNDSKNLFTKNLKEELSRLESLKSSNEYKKHPFLSYYFNLSNRLNSFKANKSDKKADSQFLESALKNDSSFLENSGLIRNTLIAYFSSELSDISSQNKIEPVLDSITSKLLDNVTCESTRGQNILQISLELFQSSKLDNLYKKYIDKAQKLTCTIKNDKLKSLLTSSLIKLGAKAPNYKFKNDLGNKSNLYDFNSKYKIIVFYASWCGHCVKEMPKVVELYNDKKNKGVDFILISVDEDEKEYKNFIKDLPNWNNYNEMEGWDSEIAKVFAINGTPTIILLDQNNVIKVISHNIEEVKKELL